MPDAQQKWNIKEILDYSEDYLKSKGVESPRVEAEWLLSHALGNRRIDLYLQFDRLLSSSESVHYKSLLQQRLDHKPLQYIIGETEFMGLSLLVNENVLIPRPETEQLVEKAIKMLENSSSAPLKVLDVGTGSGNIAIALAKFLPSVEVTAIDVSEAAINLAKENADKNDVSDKINFLVFDLNSDGFPDDMYDMVISNPPYISKLEMKTLQDEVKNWEPEVALTDHSDGIKLIEQVINKAKDSIHKGGHILIEIGGNEQKERVEKLLSNAGFLNVCVEEDYNSHARFAFAER